jgi:drug/metabolite transporter (DMT)-like permease
MTHGSWIVLYPVTLLFLRLQSWSTPLPVFWRRHTQLLRQIALTVEHQTLHPTPRQQQNSPVRYMVKMTSFITCALTLAGGSWYVAVNLTTASDLTAIYNCSAFFAYAFSIPILHEKVRTSKVVAVAIAIAGVFIVAYGDTSPAKHGSKSGGGAGGDKAPPSHEAENRASGNMVIGVGSVLYGFYEVLYKRLACPPEGASPNKGVVFANMFGSLIGLFTLSVLWVPLPILHYMGWEEFELPHGEQASMMAISVLANASMSFLSKLKVPRTNKLCSILRIFPRTYFAYFARPVFRGCAAYHLHCCDRRPASSSAAQLAAHTRRHRRRHSHHRRISPSLVGNIQGNGRGKASQTRGKPERDGRLDVFLYSTMDDSMIFKASLFTFMDTWIRTQRHFWHYAVRFRKGIGRYLLVVIASIA